MDVNKMTTTTSTTTLTDFEKLFENSSDIFHDVNGSFSLCSELEYSDYILNDTNCSSGSLFSGQAGTMHNIAALLSQVSMCIVFIVGLCGNTLVIYVVTRFSKMQTVTNLYILNLAIADELFVFGMPFLITTALLYRWVFGSVMCKLFFSMTSLNQFTSSIFLTILSADRYIAVCHPITSSKVRTPIISKLVSATGWSVSALMIVPVIMYANILEVNGVKNCNIIWPDRFEIFFTLYSFMLSFAIPVFFFIVLYSLVLHKLKSVGPNRKTKEKKKSRKKVTKMVLTVIAVYVFCYTPYWVLQVSLIFSTPGEHQSSFKKYCFLIASLMTYVNSAINPILYAFLSDNFKKSFTKACICATRTDANSSLQIETSIFPWRNRGGSSMPSRSYRDRESSITTSMLTTTKNTPNTLPQLNEFSQSAPLKELDEIYQDCSNGKCDNKTPTSQL